MPDIEPEILVVANDTELVSDDVPPRTAESSPEYSSYAILSPRALNSRPATRHLDGRLWIIAIVVFWLRLSAEHGAIA
jgi:hypothetical protein